MEDNRFQKKPFFGFDVKYNINIWDSKMSGGYLENDC